MHIFFFDTVNDYCLIGVEAETHYRLTNISNAMTIIDMRIENDISFWIGFAICIDAFDKKGASN